MTPNVALNILNYSDSRSMKEKKNFFNKSGNIVETTSADDSYCKVLTPGQLFPCSKEAIADPQSKYVL